MHMASKTIRGGFRRHFATLPRPLPSVKVAADGDNKVLLVDEASLPKGLPAPLLDDIKNGAGKAFTAYGIDCDRTVVVNLGSAENVNEGSLRSATHAAVDQLRKLNQNSANFDLANLPDGLERERSVSLVTETALLSNYRFDSNLSEDSKQENRPLESFTITTGTSSADLNAVIEEASTRAESTCLARDLANGRADKINPAYMESLCQEIAAEFDLAITVLDQEQLQKQGLNLLEAVGHGATVPPRLVAVEYQGDPENKSEKIAIVGKGITFDTGGLNLKPTGFIEDMHMDMGGAAATVGAFRGIVKLGLKANVVCVLALAENAIGPDAYKPHSIIKSLKGPTVEVGNTDAEGRLALADALTWVQQEHKPHTVVNLATLTGACVVALGEYVAGLFSNNDALAGELVECGARANEPVWRMPILEEYSAEIRGAPGAKHADLRSIGKGREAGACTAAAFLQEFIEEGVAWAHVDIAGPAMFSEPRGYKPKGGTGFGAQLLVELARRKAE